MTKAATGPTKTDLFQVVNEVDRLQRNFDSVPAYAKALQEEEDADQALEEFYRKNAEYKRLHRRASAAGKKRAAVYQKVRNDHLRDVLRARNTVRVSGVSAKSIATVKALAKKYLGIDV